VTDHVGVNGDSDRTGRMLPRLRQDHPRWRIWASDTGRLYATRAGISVDEPGASVTVDGLTSAELRAAIAGAEGLAARYGNLMV
jgi:hypothetical protein